MADFELVEKIEKRGELIGNIDGVLGRGMCMPNNNANSGQRKLMYSVQLEHTLALCNPEHPVLGTGYENRFGEYASSLDIANSDYQVIAMIPKFSSDPTRQYVSVLQNVITGEYTTKLIVEYQHITETYGYLMNNNYINNKKPGDIIKAGDTITKSLAYDEFNNRLDGINLVTAYIASEYNKEDGVRLCKSAAERLSSPLIKKITIPLNDNDILLNLYGDHLIYKPLPNLGEFIHGGIVAGVRREKKEESLYTQSVNRLRDFMLSDEKYLAEGYLADITIYCNNPDNLNTFYNEQIKQLYEDNMRFHREMVQILGPIIEGGFRTTYDLQKMYHYSKKVMDGKQYIKDGKAPSNMLIEMTIIEYSPVHVGDKICNRYGGKGVVSEIIPDELMPMLSNGQHVEIIFNPATCINRENMGQLLESSITHISSKLVDMMNSDLYDIDECLEIYFKYLDALVPTQSKFIRDYVDGLKEDDKVLYLQTVLNDKGIYVAMKPISESIDIDVINRLYQTFPEVGKYNVVVPIEDSNGNIRYVPTSRELVCGKQYIYRLKQYAEEKFSATSLSATNIRSENSRSSAKRSYKVAHQKTPVKFGEMESGDLSHIDMEVVVSNYLIHSASPKGRRLTEALLTDDPFNIDIKLDNESRNRGVEKVNTKLFVLGLELNFKKIPKVKKALMSQDLISFSDPRKNLISFNPRLKKLKGDLDPLPVEMSRKNLITRDLIRFREE